ncbi:MAG: Rrf2 family transcriptional regulator [Hyphomicrobiaceae bacterium]
MELNTAGRYAVMAMADLAKQESDAATSLATIAARQNLSAAYLEQLFLKLRRAGLVESARGRHGGYRLGRRACDISIADIMRAVEEETRMTSCLGENSVGCRGKEKCLTHDLWHALGENIRGFLESVSLQEVLDGIPAAKRRSRTAARGLVLE